MIRRSVTALGALAAILAVTAAWWALALWPAGDTAPAWLDRTREVCFGVVAGGLPNAGGWILLIGEPLGMLGFLLVVWGDAVREGMVALRRSGPGRALLVVSGGGLALGLTAAVARVASAAGAAESFALSSYAPAEAVRVDRPAPALELIDQTGDTVRLEDFRGRPVVVAFVYAHCETVCPLLVRNAVQAVGRARSADAVLLVVTLDPWRDTPERLGPIAVAWQLPEPSRMLGGSVEAVERALDAWGIPRARDSTTGAIVHPATVQVIDRNGRLAYVTHAAPDRLAGLIDRL